MPKKQPIALLLDGDIFAFQAASAAEFEFDHGDGFIVLWSDFDDAMRKANEKINRLIAQFNADEVIFAVTDDHNWRKDVLPTYKGNRKDVRKPIALRKLKEALAERFRGYLKPGLEADDVLGILATWDSFLPGYRKIIVSEDKDLRTIPAEVFNPAKDSKPRLITEAEADRWHLVQSTAGDATDGYSGCPGIGVQTIEQAFSDRLGWECYEHTFKSGQRKGETEVRWRRVEMGSDWDIVLSHYHKAGLGEDEALRQARVARICRASDYDFKNKEVILWKPSA